MRKRIFALLIFLAMYLFSFSQSITDIDGNFYQTINIGTQTWMRENLKATHYSNGDSIPNVTVYSMWRTLVTGAYCNYANNTSYVPVYGRLYNWYAATDPRNVCPIGWHVPADSEWTVLVNYLGGDSVAGGKMKEVGTTHWLAPNTGASNSSGFTALPGGGRQNYTGSTFSAINRLCCLWSTASDTLDPAEIGLFRYIGNDSKLITRSPGNKFVGFSVRCLKNFPSGVIETPKDGGSKLNLWPCPAKDNFTVIINRDIQEPYKLEIISLVTGSVLQTMQATENQLQIDISQLPVGVYSVRTVFTNEMIIKKLVKQ